MGPRRPLRLPGLAGAGLAGLALLASLTGLAAPGILAGIATAAPAVLQGIRSWSDTEKLRLVLDLSQPVVFRSSLTDEGMATRVFLPDVVLAPDLAREIVFEDSLVRAVRVGEREGGLEVTVYHGSARSVTPFDFAPAEGQPYRIVLDIPRGASGAGEALGASGGPEASGPAESSPPTAGRSHAGDRIVVIDPGHGGEHTGAVGHKRTIEKLVNLTISRKIAERLDAIPGVRVLMTRYGDYNVPLRDRYRMADSCRADAFISVHANSSKRRNNRGTEVFFLSLASASDEQDMLLADIENAADAVEANPFEEEVTGILFDLKQQEALRHSQMLAEAILNQITEDRRLSSRGVKQAPFAVLKSPIVPSVLVETAFINHPEEAKLLRDPKFQDRMADQIVRGVVQYLEIAPVVARNGAAESYFRRASSRRGSS